MNYELNPIRRIDSDLFDSGWKDASLGRKPEHTDWTYISGYVGWMRSNLQSDEQGFVNWGKVKPQAGATDSKEYCSCPF